MDDLLQQFISKYTGATNVGNTPENIGQCVGLVSVWQDVLQVPHEYGNASDLLANADTSFFNVIYNDPTNTNQFPVEGDIMVWGTTWGDGFGHTAIIVTANGTNFTSFEANDVTVVDPNGACEILSHDYSGVSGWLHFIGTLPTVTPSSSSSSTMFTLPSGAQVDLSNPSSMQVCATLWDAVVNLKQYIPLSEVNSVCTTLGIPTGSTTDAINTAIISLQKDKATDDATIANLNKQIPTLEASNSTLTNEVTSLEQQLKTAQTASTEPTSGIDYQTLYIQAEANLQKAQVTNATSQATITALQKQINATKPTTFSSKLKFLFG